MKSATYIDQKSSILLTKEENEQIFKLLGHKCQSLASTVIQLYATDGPESVHWVKKDIGILCLVRDTIRRSYFFRLFCLVRKNMVWEHEIYNDMQYLAPRSFLHTFEAEERIVAFNFANENEATHMRGILLEKLKTKEQKRLERQKKGHVINSRNHAPARPAPMPNLNTISNGYLSSNSKANSSKKFKKKSITKDDIGSPQNFQHVSHVGFDKDMGFKMENIDNTMRQFFEKAGISENDLKDKETMEYIYDFIERNGGYDAVKQNIQQSIPPPPCPPSPPPVPHRNVPPPASTFVRMAPPPPPPGSHPAMHPAPPPPPLGPPPLNVVVQRSQDQQKRRSEVRHGLYNTTAPPNCSNVPVPPPPPPLPATDVLQDISTPPALNISQDNGTIRSSSPDTRSALMEEIIRGTRLKHVEVESKKLSGDVSRVAFLKEIEKGVELKSVPQVNKSSMNSNDLASALARALAERAERMHTDSSASSDADDSDNEWDD